MLLIILATATLTLGIRLKAASEVKRLPPYVLKQFLDYNLIIHFDNKTAKYLDYIMKTKDPDNQLVYLINYDEEINKIDKRPDGNKYINIVLLENPFNFQVYSDQPFNFWHYDFVLFLVKRFGRRQQIWSMKGLPRAAGCFMYNSKVQHLYYCCYYCGNNTAVLKKAPILNLRSLLNNYSDFNGHIFRVGYAQYPPFFWWKPYLSKPIGAEGAILYEFSRLHNFRYVFNRSRKI